MTNRERTGGQILVDQLLAQGVTDVFCVPGESYLAALDALHDAAIRITVCRQEGGAAMMAEAHGKLTGRPGICFVTRGPGATNASAGVHVAMQDSTPMILFVGQVARGMRGREAFQEVDMAAFFAPLAKWAVEVDDPARLPEIVGRAVRTALSGRPGPVVVALPEDMLTARAVASDAPRAAPADAAPAPQDLARALDRLAAAGRPLAIVGGSRWTEAARTELIALAERMGLPVAVSFRRQALFPGDHPLYAGDLGPGADTALLRYLHAADALLLLGGRMSEMASQGYTALDIPVPRPALIHVHPDPDELGRVYAPTVAIAAPPPAFLSAALAAQPPQVERGALTEPLRAAVAARRAVPAAGGLNMAAAVTALADALPEDAVICNGAGNYATWVHRFVVYRRWGSQLAPTSGSMGYGLPAAIAAARAGRTAIAFAGDGCFLMTGQEFATAVQYGLPVIVVVVDNGMYGTIRMQQERAYPRREVATALTNPDFAAMARAFGGHGETVQRTEDVLPAFERARASGLPAVLHCLVDPEAITVDRGLSEIRGR